jgi:hypothetical protein
MTESERLNKIQILTHTHPHTHPGFYLVDQGYYATENVINSDYCHLS